MGLLLQVLLVASLVGACATARTYEGDARARDEVAIVEGTSGWDPLNRQTVDIETVDGVPVEGFFTRDVELLPGPHEIGVEAKFKFSSELIGTYDEAVVLLDAKAGGRYAIGVRRLGMSELDIFVVDLESGEIVGWAIPELSDDDAPVDVPGMRGAWKLVIGKQYGSSNSEHFAWIRNGEEQGAWTGMVELVMVTEADPLERMPTLRTELERNVKPRVLADEPELVAYATTSPGDAGWFVSVTRPGTGCLYLFTYQVREGELSEALARDWVDRFRRATLHPWTPPD